MPYGEQNVTHVQVTRPLGRVTLSWSSRVVDIERFENDMNIASQYHPGSCDKTFEHLVLVVYQVASILL